MNSSYRRNRSKSEESVSLRPRPLSSQRVFSIKPVYFSRKLLKNGKKIGTLNGQGVWEGEDELLSLRRMLEFVGANCSMAANSFPPRIQALLQCDLAVPW